MLRLLAFVLSSTFFLASPFVERLSAQEPAPIRDATAKIEAALAAPAEMEYLDTPLGDVVQDLKKRYAIPIELELESLAADGKGPDTPITIKLKGISLASALNRLLSPLGSSWIVEDETLLFLTKSAESAPERVLTRVYPVGNLLGSAERPDFDSLIEIIRSFVREQDWSDNGGTIGSIKHHRPTKSLIVGYTYHGHREVAALLKTLRTAMVADAKELSSEGLSVYSDAVVMQALKSPSQCEFIDTPLSDVVEFLQSQHRIPIVIESEALAADGIGTDIPVTLTARDTTLEKVLNRLLHKYGLDWTIGSETVLISTPPAIASPEKLVLRVYQVADLLEEEDYIISAFGLEETIQQSNPNNWVQNGGTIALSKYFAPAKSLVVSHTMRGHREIDDLLRQLRSLPKSTEKKSPPALTTRFYPIADIAVGYQGPIKESTTPLQLRFTDDATVLISTLRGAVLPESWSKSDAAGDRPTVIADRLTQSLVVRQSPRGHAAVGQYLDQLRRDLLKHRPTPVVAPTAGGAGEGK